MNRFLIIVLLAGLAACDDPGPQPPNPPPAPTPPAYTEKDVYYYSYTTIDGDNKKISDYKGKKILFVNTASQCSNTPQYSKLQALYEKYDSMLVIIGFPCNQFGFQEPGDVLTIKDFCTNNYHITFPMSDKIDVKGPSQHALYKWLTTKDLNGKLQSEVAWNFQKYLVDENGVFVAMFADTMQPDDPAIIAAIEE
jgi:glutathione peroxidase